MPSEPGTLRYFKNAAFPVGGKTPDYAFILQELLIP